MTLSILTVLLATFAWGGLIKALVIILIILAAAYFIIKYAPIPANLKGMISAAVYIIAFFAIVIYLLNFFGLWHS